MKKCPYCGRDNQDAARVCAHCGRRIMAGASEKKRVLPKKRTGPIVLGCAALLVVALAGVLAVLFWRSASDRKPIVALTTPETSPTVSAAAASAAKNKRLFLQESLDDNAARADFFQNYVRSTGERCEGIEKAMMRSPGSWIITCKPGYIYTFKFDKNGELSEAKKMN